MQLCFNQFSILIFSKIHPVFKDYRKVQSYIFSFSFSFLQQCMRPGAVIQQHYPYFCCFKHLFCCKTKLGGHFKGGVIPFSFFKINFTDITSINLKGWSGQSKYCLKSSIRVFSSGKLDFLMLYLLLLEKISS